MKNEDDLREQERRALERQAEYMGGRMKNKAEGLLERMEVFVDQKQEAGDIATAATVRGFRADLERLVELSAFAAAKKDAERLEQWAACLPLPPVNDSMETRLGEDFAAELAEQLGDIRRKANEFYNKAAKASTESHSTARTLRR